MAIKYLAGNRIQGLSTDRQTSSTATINFTKHFAMSDCSSYSSYSSHPSTSDSSYSEEYNKLYVNLHTTRAMANCIRKLTHKLDNGLIYT